MEFTAKTVDEAVANALSELGATEDQVTIEIKEQPTKGLFGKLKGKAVIEVNLKEVEKPQQNNEEKAVDLVVNVPIYKVDSKPFIIFVISFSLCRTFSKRRKNDYHLKFRIIFFTNRLSWRSVRRIANSSRRNGKHWQQRI